jgi:hypothetical protein
LARKKPCEFPTIPGFEPRTPLFHYTTSFIPEDFSLKPDALLEGNYPNIQAKIRRIKPQELKALYNTCRGQFG